MPCNGCARRSNWGDSNVTENILLDGELSLTSYTPLKAGFPCLGCKRGIWKSD
jgi:hypothetical protein